MSQDLERLKTGMSLAASAAMILASLSLLWMAAPALMRRPAAKTIAIPRDPVSIAGAQVKGSPQAPVALIEYTDLECPFCRQFFNDVLPSLEKDYFSTGKVLLALRHLPLAIHPNALRAAEAAECAGRQNRFWNMHDALFRAQTSMDEPFVLLQADTMGLKRDAFVSCLHGNAEATIRTDQNSARTFNIDSTPTFLIGHFENDRRVRIDTILRGVGSLDSFKQMLDSALAKAVPSGQS